MPQTRIFILLIFCWLALYSATVWSARPFVTDDARLTNAGHCQLESWTRVYPQSVELWALPACNPTGNLEITLGGGSFHNQTDASTSRDYLMQLKTLFKPLDSQQFGVGLALGHIAHPEVSPGPNQFGNTYLYVPISYAFANQRVLHLNLGLVKERGTHQLKTTLGLGAEWPIHARWLGIAEVYGDHTQSPFYQLGMRLSVIPNLLQVDATTGGQMHGHPDTQWLSIGVRYTP